jgi:hypothetical protein
VTEIAMLMVPMDARITFDLDRWGIATVFPVPEDVLVEAHVAKRVRGEAATIFASPKRRWRDVMGAVRAACQVVAGGVSLRFYGPDCMIDVRSPVFGDRYGLCPLFDPREGVSDAQAAVALKRAVKDGIADLLGAEMRRLAGEALAHHRGAGRVG